MSEQIIAAQRGHAFYRAAELRAQSTADSAREDAARALAALEALGGDRIDGGLPECPMEAAVELDRRAYELENPPRREHGATRGTGA